MKVIGIDPAPSKETIIYSKDTGFISKQPTELKKYIDDLQGNGVLLCWDAPLTASVFGSKIDFYTRPLEKIVNTIDKNEKDKKYTRPPSGISTLGYAGCPHWVITQYCLDLPSVYNDESRGAFKLVTDEPTNKPTKLNLSAPCIVEVHPALALWCWLNKDYDGGWHYKGGNKKDEIIERKNNLEALTDKLQNVISEFGEKIDTSKIKNDSGGDFLDAYIAWLLGELWANETKNKNGENAVILVGNRDTGAILLPNTDWSQELNRKLEPYK